MSILNVDKIQPIGGGSTITVDATDIQASTGTITANSYTGVDNTLKVSIGGTEYVRTHSTGQVSIGSTFMWRSDTVAQVYGKSPDLSLSRFNDQFMISGNETSGAINTGAGIQFFGHDGVQERGMAYIRGLKENGTSGNRASYLAFATRANGGTLEERLRIHSNGKISTGVNNNSYELTIGGLSGGPTLWLRDSGTSGSPRILFGSTSAALIGGITYNNSSNHMEFATNGGEKVRINSSGQILVGTTAHWGSDVKLHLANSGNTYLTITSGTTHNGVLAFSDDGSERGAIDYDHNGDHMLFKTAASERLRITSTGRVGINENSPDAQLHIKDTNPRIILEGTNGSGRQHEIWSSGGNSQALQFTSGELYYNADIHVFRASNETTHYARIDSSGDMGLGTSTIENFGGGHITLEVAGTTTSQGGVFKTATSDSAGTGSSGTEMIMFTDNTKGAINVVSADPLTFSTANTERARIQSDGKFGIGDFSSTTVAQALHVRASEPKIYLEHTGGYDMTLTTSDGMGMNGITVNGGFLSLAYNNKNIVMCRTGGNVGINSTSPREKFDVSGSINAGGKNAPVFSIRNELGTYIRSFKHYFDVSKGNITGNAQNRTILNITVDESFHQAGFEVTYFTRLQAVSDTQVRPNKIIFGVNRFNSSNTVNVTKTVVEQHTDAANHCDVNVVSISGTNYQIQMQFGSQPNVSSAAAGWIEGATVLGARFADVDYYYGART